MSTRTPDPSSSISTRNHPQQQTRYHPYSLNSNLLAYRRTGPPSIASTATTSYAPSIASTSTVVPSLTLQRQDNLRIKVNTSVAPSSHIWDEFYKEHGRPLPSNESDNEEGRLVENEMEEFDGTTNRQPPSSSQPIPPMPPSVEYSFNEDTTISELLSMFELPSETQNSINGVNSTPSHHLSTTTALGDYPGAEFLNLPDTASTLDAQFPNLDEFDFTQFNFGNPLIPSTTTAQSGGDGLQNGDLEDVATRPVSTDNEGAQDIHEIGLNSSNSIMELSPSNEDTSVATNHPSSVQSGDSIGQDISTQPSHFSIKNQATTLSASVPLHTDVLSSIVGQLSPIPNEENNTKKSLLHLSNKCTPFIIDSSCPSSVTSSTTNYPYPHLRRMKMKALSTDKDVIRFQKEVLNVAAKFYTDLADVFENTPSDIIRLGMSRTGVLVEDDTISDVLEDIKSLCGRLTAKASDIPGYPADEEEDISMSGEEIQEEIPPPTVLVPPTAHLSAQRGSISEPIDLTASTPRSEGVTPAALPNIPLPVPPVGTSQHPLSQATRARTDEVSTPRSSPPGPGLGSRHLHDPFTPESLGAGPASVLPTASTSPLCPGSTPSLPSYAYTPAAHSLPAQTPLARMLLDLPPLPNPTNRVIHGPWKPSEVERLRTLVAFSRDVEDNAPIDHTDWSWVVDNFGGTRNRHQVLIKAVELGLRETSTHHSRRVKQKGYRDAIAAMETELTATTSKPLQSPIPPLLPSAQITPRPPRLGATPRRHSDVVNQTISVDGDAGKLVKTPLMLGESGRRESDTSVLFEPSDTAKTPPRDSSLPRPGTRKPLPRALDLSFSPSKERERESSMSSIRPDTSPIRPGSGTGPGFSPYTPRSRINTMAFKPYSHPSSAPPRPTGHGNGHGHGRTLSGWRLVNMAGSNDGRASVISPTFGGFALTGYQLAPTPSFGNLERRAEADESTGKEK
ncbi:hypothetical protein L486_01535 [Kwoniella mangroviensis CBS 10435]|uniref:Uncharacterized protein n=1 Tax=Kwoniella mangroviensis CBS 10435 TaxID=1331196 RepID=A0A1B9J259_9TREE|nr:hypothetical protein L486_01535 [Kwoniella mangroviensis CBS 10435]